MDSVLEDFTRKVFESKAVSISMNTLRKYVFGMFVFLLIASPVSASTLTANQVNSIISLLQAFGVNQTTIGVVYSELIGENTTSDIPVSNNVPVSIVQSSLSSCIENPVLILVATTTPNSIKSERYDVSGSYTTGCDLRLDTSFKYDADNWRFGSGTFGIRDATDFNGIKLEGDITDPNFHIWTFNVNSIPNTDIFTLTVGNTTQSITIQ